MGELCLAYVKGGRNEVVAAGPTMLFYVKTSMDTVTSTIRMAAQGDGGILATLAAS